MIGKLHQLPIVVLLFYYLLSLYSALLFPGQISIGGLNWLILIACLFPVQRFKSSVRSSKYISRSDALLFILVVVTGFSVAAQHTFYDSYTGFDGVATQSQLTKIWGVSMIWLLVGCSCAFFNFQRSNIFSLLLTAAVAICIIGALDGGVVIDYYSYKIATGNFEISHLGIENGLIFIFYFAYSLTSKFKMLVATVAVAVLFASGGRSSLFLFLLVILAYDYLFRKDKNIPLISLGFLLLAILLYSLVYFEIVYLDDPAVRKILFLDGLSTDSSFQARGRIFMQSLSLLPSQIIVGDVSAISRLFGARDYYFHNLLSAWQFYGLPVFIFLIWLLYKCYRKVSVIQSKSVHVKIEFSVLILLYTIASVIISKSAAFELLWFTLGYWIYQRSPNGSDNTLSQV